MKNAVNSVCMAGSHFDLKRIEVYEVLEFFRFGKTMSAAAAQQFSGPESAIIEVHSSFLCLLLSLILNFRHVACYRVAKGKFHISSSCSFNPKRFRSKEYMRAIRIQVNYYALFRYIFISRN